MLTTLRLPLLQRQSAAPSARIFTTAQRRTLSISSCCYRPQSLVASASHSSNSLLHHRLAQRDVSQAKQLILPLGFRNMSSTRDVSKQSDISKSTMENDGSFKRLASTFRSTIEKGGQLEPEAGRYHLYVSYACPWAHRTLITRELKGLHDIIGLSVVSPRMGNHGWPFANVDAFPGADADPVNNAEHIKDIYLKVEPQYTGRFTVPVLFDKKTGTIVNNESSEILRIFNTAFNDMIPEEKAAIDLYPEALRAEIEASHEWVYPTVNNGVYRSGFASSQGAYEEAVKALFESLDRIEKIFESQQKNNANSKGEYFLIGNHLTESDIRLYTTIVRFDPVYHGHFKCNYRTIRDGYPLIHKWMQNLYWNYPEFKETTNFDHIKTHYYWSHSHINPTRVVPLGPIPNIRPL